MSDACEGCRRRARLVGQLAPWIAGLLRRPDRRARGLLALDDERLIAAIGGNAGPSAHRLLETFDGEADRHELDRLGIGIVCHHSASYPPPLLALEDRPAALYLSGDAGCLARLSEEPAVTVVGARRASRYAIEVSYELGRGLGAAGLSVVSGLALGVDAAGHRGVLDAGGRAIAVLAGGVDVPYPRTNRSLHERLRENGVLISELPPGRRPFRWGFPARNRIMAGLSTVTVLVEAGEGSGSLLTAAFAQDLGREVGAVPGRVNSRMAAGTNRLLREGALVIRGPEDVLDDVYGAGRAPGPSPGAARAPGLAAEAQSPAPALDPSLHRVLDAVEADCGIDAVGRQAGLSAGEARAALGRLELLGLVARDAFGTYARTGRRPGRQPPYARG